MVSPEGQRRWVRRGRQEGRRQGGMGLRYVVSFAIVQYARAFFSGEVEKAGVGA